MPSLPARPRRPPSLNRLHTLTAGYRELRSRLEQGGGPEKIRRQHHQGKVTARPRRPPPLTRPHPPRAGYGELRSRLEQGGGPEKIRRQHDQGKLTARERVAALLDKGGERVGAGLLG